MPFAKNNPFGIRGGSRQANTQAEPPFNGKNDNSSFHSFRERDAPESHKQPAEARLTRFLGE